MSVTTTAVLSYAHQDPFVVADVWVDDPQSREILVRIEASGICHTDLVNRIAGKPDSPILLGMKARVSSRRSAATSPR